MIQSTHSHLRSIVSVLILFHHLRQESPLLTVFARLVQQTLSALNAVVADGRQAPFTNHKVQPIKSDLVLSLPDPEFSNYGIRDTVPCEGRAWGVKRLSMRNT